MQQRGVPATYEDKPTTIWLASDQAKNNYNLIPFGWALVQIDSENIDENISQLCQNYHQDYLQKQQEKIHKLKKQQEIQQAHDKKLQEIQDKKNKIKQQRNDYINNLPPFERELEKEMDRRPNKAESAAVFLFNKLKQDNWENEQDKKQVAQKIQQIWQDEKKWLPVFAGTNKQKKKQQQKCQQLSQYL
jgi:CRISPR-associated protein Csm5